MGCASLRLFSTTMIKLTNNFEWGKIDWAKTRRSVRGLQNRIYKAKKAGKKQIVWKLQMRLINSFDAKCLSVLQVTTLNKGKSTPGVDKQVITSNKQKERLIPNLTLDGKAKPIRRVMIPKPGKTELRPLGIPTILDRAKQCLAKLALEPEWEAVFEPNSYGFRPGRSCHDAIEAIFLNLHHNRVKYVYDADIRKCFDRIDHDALINKINTFPQMRKQILAWLKADIMAELRSSEVMLSTAGTPQGGIISPLLANIALDGLENHLKFYVANLNINTGYKQQDKSSRSKNLGFVRYADDFLIIHQNKKILELCIEETKLWLKTIGLEISEEKSTLRDAREGFQFLGFQVILVRKMYKYKVKIMPSKRSCQRLIENIRSVVKQAKTWSTYNLIRILRPKILGWANYFRYSECKNTFHRLTNAIFGMIRAWVFRRDNRNGRKVIKLKYFPSGITTYFNNFLHKDNWILRGKTKDKKGVIRENFLPHIVWVKSLKHVKVLGTNSIYDSTLSMYWYRRLAKHSTYPPSIQKLLKIQKCRCTRCKVEFDGTERMEIDHIIPVSMGGGSQFENLNLIHKTCHIAKTREDVQRYKNGLSDFELQKLLAKPTLRSSGLRTINKTHINTIEDWTYDQPTLDEIYTIEGF